MRFLQKLQGFLSVYYQYLLPKRSLSRLAGYLMQSEQSWIAKPLIKGFIRHYRVDLSEALYTSPDDYPHFNAFFTRRLQPAARTITPLEQAVASPADGVLSQYGQVKDGTLIQAKDHLYTVARLLGGDTALASLFTQGAFAAIYLAPNNYHRVHMPYPGRLKQMIYVSGQLFSVNLKTANAIPQLFTRNERVAACFETPQGHIAVVMVGAMLVGSIATAWTGIVNADHPKKQQQWTYSDIQKTYVKGEYIGHFQLGSTVILLTEKTLQWEKRLLESHAVRVGQALAYYH